MADMGILMNAQWQYLGGRAAILPPQIYSQVTFVWQEKETVETNRARVRNSSPLPD